MFLNDEDFLYSCPVCGWVGEWSEVEIYAWETDDDWGNDPICPVCWEKDCTNVFCDVEVKPGISKKERWNHA